MKRFLIKFLILFAIIDGCLGISEWYIKPNLSGDIGELGQIPFGKAYNDSILRISQRAETLVTDYAPEAEITDSVLVIGDSFSLHGMYGFSQYVGENLNCHILNIRKHLQVPEQSFIQLVNTHRIPEGSLVIVESGERGMTKRLSGLNFSDTTAFNITPYKSDKSNSDLLSNTIMWLLKSAGIKQPIHCFRTHRDLFSHPTIHNEIYVYDSPWDNDGDFRFVNLTEADYDSARKNLHELKALADAHHIRLLYLVATDKYDAYEPFIEDAPMRNPTLDHLPDEEWIVNTKPLLQTAINAGVKDVYYLNDTHWSPVGAQIAGNEVAERIKHLYLQ